LPNDRAALGEVERLALGRTPSAMSNRTTSPSLLRGEVSQRAADHAGADKGDLRASHSATTSF
jgi:hypothetical protein